MVISARPQTIVKLVFPWSNFLYITSNFTSITPLHVKHDCGLHPSYKPERWATFPKTHGWFWLASSWRRCTFYPGKRGEHQRCRGPGANHKTALMNLTAFYHQTTWFVFLRSSPHESFLNSKIYTVPEQSDTFFTEIFNFNLVNTYEGSIGISGSKPNFRLNSVSKNINFLGVLDAL